jgi:hypothetical protein
MKSETRTTQLAGHSPSIATLFVTAIALVMLGLSLSHGGGNARAEARPVAAASTSQSDGTVASAERDEMNSARGAQGHSELILQLD